MAEAKGFDWERARARLAELGRLIEHMDENVDIAAVLDARADRYRVLEQQQQRDGELHVLFVRGETRYALPIASIAEIRIADHITALPGVSPVIKGIVNVRGRMLAVHDLGSFAMSPRELPEVPWLLIGYGELQDAALLADDVDGIRRIFPAERRPVPLTMSAKGPGFCAVGDDGLVILDAIALFATDNFAFA